MHTTFSKTIREKAYEVGFQKVGITDPVFDEKQKEELDLLKKYLMVMELSINMTQAHSQIVDRGHHLMLKEM